MALRSSHAWRSLIARPGYVAFVLVILALGFGLNGALWGVIEGVLRRPLPYADAHELVVVREATGTGPDEAAESPAELRAFEKVARFRGGEATLTVNGESQRIHLAAVSASFFEVFGTPPASGRGLLSRDAADPSVVVLSSRLALRGGLSVGDVLFVDLQPVTVVGVMPPTFNFPVGTEAWVPASGVKPEFFRGSILFHTIGRLRPGMSVEAASAAIRGFLPRGTPDAAAAPIVPLHTFLQRGMGPGLVLLQVLAGLVLGIAVLSAWWLQSVRLLGRRGEIATRLALGANWWDLAWLLCGEVLLLAAAAAAASVGVAGAVLAVIKRSLPPFVEQTFEIGVTLRVVGLIAILNLALGAMAGLAGTLRLTRLSDIRLSALLSGSDTGRVTQGGGWVRALTAFQGILMTGLLAAAVLLGRGLYRVATTPPGLDVAEVATFQVTDAGSPNGVDPNKLGAILDALQGVPGVAALGATSHLLFRDRGGFRMAVSDVAMTDRKVQAHYRQVSAGYFEALRIPLRSGRAFDEREDRSIADALVVNEKVASALWPGENAVGRLVAFPGQVNPLRVVGVVDGVRHFGLDAEPEPEVYASFVTGAPTTFSVVVRSKLSAYQVGTLARNVVKDIEPAMAVHGVRSLADVMAATFQQRKLYATIAMLFAVNALALVVASGYATAAYAARARSREMAIRAVLGATPEQIVRAMIGRVASWAPIGLAGGWAFAFVLARMLGSRVHGVAGGEQWSAAAAALVVQAVAIASAYRAARDNMGGNPADVLKT